MAAVGGMREGSFAVGVGGLHQVYQMLEYRRNKVRIHS
jgi:hypothetical protein